MKSPVRLLEDPGVASELRDDLARAAHADHHYDAVAGLVALQAALALTTATAVSSTGAAPGMIPSTTPGATGATTGAAGAAASTTTLSLGIKAGLALLGAVAVATGIAVWPSASHDAPTTPVSTHEAAPTAPAHATKTVPPVLPPNAPAEAAPPIPPEALAPAAPSPSARKGSASTDPRHEIEQLARIKHLVETDPRAAYRLANAGHVRFPNGVLHQEREALAVLALFHMQEHAKAQARARRFLTRYPHSPLRERLTQLAGER